MSKLGLYFIAFPLSFFLNMWWAGYVAESYYRQKLGVFFRPEISWFPFMFLFALYAATLVCFVIGPAVRRKRPRDAFVNGLLFGLTAYATFDFTNMALMQGWPFLFSLLDIGWGGLLTGIVCLATYLIATKAL